MILLMTRAKILSSVFGATTAFYSMAFLQDSANLTFAPSITYGLLAGLATGGMSYGILRGRVEALKENAVATKDHLLRIDTKLDGVSNDISEIKGMLGRRKGDTLGT